MKKLFRKATAIIANTALIGMTVGVAAAAAYPEPFTSNTAIVVGANAAPSDNIAAASIASNLDANAATGAVSVEGGDSFKLEKTSVNFNLGNSITDFESTLDEDDMPTALAEGVYKDANRDEYDFEQSITLKDANLTLFTDSKYNDKEPTIGFNILKNAEIMDYTIEFKDGGIDYDAIVGTDLPLMGNLYYVLSADNVTNELELLDSSSDTVATEGVTSSLTVDGESYSVTIEYVSENEAKLTINGETTDKLSDGDSYELADGSYVAIKEILYASKDSGVSKVEFTIGAGKLTLASGVDIEINDEAIDGVSTTFTLGSNLNNIVVNWDAADELFLTEDDSVISMPGFDAFQVVFGGLEFSDAEATELAAGDQLTLEAAVKDGALDLEVLNFATVDGNMTFGGVDYNLVYAAGNDVALTQLGDYFVVSYSDDNGAEYATYAYELSKVANTSETTEIVLSSLTGGNDITFDGISETEEEGNIEFTLTAFDNDDDSATITVTNVAGTDAIVSTNKVYTADGLTITLPAFAVNATTATFGFQEANKDGEVETGDTFSADVTSNVAEEAIEVTSVTGANFTEVDALADSEEIAYAYTELATSYVLNKDADLNTFVVSYYGDEVVADVQISAGDAITADAGVMTVLDTEVATVAGKNLVVIGGSAINAIAAELLGGAYSEATFTSATDVSAGEFLIQSFARSGNTALLVAGYNAADTEKAVTYLLNNDVDTSVGTAMKGTSATEATVVTA